MNKFFAGIVSLTLSLGLSTPVFAQATPLSVAADITYVNVDSENMGMVSNFNQTGANTGYNFARNTTTMTGEAGAGAKVGSNVNSTSTGILVEDTSSPVAVNDMTTIPDLFSGFGLFGFGPTAIAADLTIVNVDNFNMGFVANRVNTSANTGRNITTNGSSITGDGMSLAEVSTTANTNTTEISVSDFSMGPVAANLLGGTTYSNPLAVAVKAQVAMVDNFNMALVGNLVTTSTNTGYNLTTGGNASTGMAIAGANVSTSINDNHTSVTVNDAGVGPIAVNELPEAGYDSMAIVAKANEGHVHNMNSGAIMNNVTTGANTGYNTNTGSLTSNTGMAMSGTVVTNTANSNENTVNVTNTSSPAAVNTTATPTLVTGASCVPTLPTCGGVTGGAVAANVGQAGVAITVDASVAVVDNQNNAAVVNNTNTQSNTGNNITTGTTGASGAGGIGTGTNTGSAVSSTEVTNNVNTNTTTVVVVH